MSIHKLLLVALLCFIGAVLVSAVGEVMSCTIRQFTWGDASAFALFVLAIVTVAWNAAAE